jgi:ABC-2 type transport system ATP-binding protein
MIRAQNVSKYYGAKRALGPVSFEIADGETVGFLGLNGAGKTTALRIFACDLRPSGGTVRVGETDAIADPHEVRKRIGFLPENPPLYMDMTVSDFLDFAGRLRGMSGGEVGKRMPTVLELTDLGDVAGDMIGTLSHGYRQRVGVAQAIIHEPRLLILDEPTRGLDPVQIVEMRSLLRNLKQNHTVLISSHILTEISETCDRILVLGQGEIIASGTEAELSRELTSTGRTEVIVRARGAVAPAELIGKIDGVSGCKQLGEEDGALLLEVASAADVRAEVCRALVEGGHDVLKLARAERELENIFLKLVQGSGRSTDAGGDRAKN